MTKDQRLQGVGIANLNRGGELTVRQFAAVFRLPPKDYSITLVKKESGGKIRSELTTQELFNRKRVALGSKVRDRNLCYLRLALAL